MERMGFYRTLHGTPPPSDVPRCVVCADTSSGIHYGVNSCEGCKGFFRRCMVKGMSQQCTNNETCEITRFARNSCQFCRLKKCIRMGMSRSASKVGRRPKTTAVCATEVKVASETPSNRKSAKLSSHRRSQSLILNQTGTGHSNNGSEPSTSCLTSPYQSASSSPVLPRQQVNVFNGARKELESLQTSSPFTTTSGSHAQMWRPTGSSGGILSYMVEPPSPFTYDDARMEPSTIPGNRQIWEQQQLWQDMRSNNSNEPLYLGTRPQQQFHASDNWSLPDAEEHHLQTSYFKNQTDDSNHHQF